MSDFVTEGPSLAYFEGRAGSLPRTHTHAHAEQLILMLLVHKSAGQVDKHCPVAWAAG